ncbi:MAG: redoxin domain-containing protein [Fidelibacterota bacterium]
MVQRFSSLAWIPLIGFTGVFSQTIEVGDTLRTLTAPVCANGEGEFSLDAYDGARNGGDYSVTWMTFLASWCIPCQTEAPITESIFQSYKDQGLKVLGVGFEWGYPYSCEEWSETFGLSYPLLDDDDSLRIVEMFQVVYVPFQVIIDHNMVVRYAAAGWDENAVTDSIEALLAEMNTASVRGEGAGLTANLPVRPELRQIHPNPFNSATSIVYVLPYDSPVTLDIFDLSGRHLKTLERTSGKGAGTYRVQWQPGSRGSGIYLVRLQTPHAVETRKVLFVK